MAGRDSPPPLDSNDQPKKQISVMFSYADDRSAKVSLIRSILKKNQEYALPSDLPKDLILEAKVRSDKRFALNLQGPSIDQIPSKPAIHAPLQTDDHVRDNPFPDLT